jgi:predicted nucleic acid-binding protein
MHGNAGFGAKALDNNVRVLDRNALSNRAIGRPASSTLGLASNSISSVGRRRAWSARIARNCRLYGAIYQDVPCDFADATLLVLAERTGVREIITLDRHFHAYRVGGQPLLVKP